MRRGKDLAGEKPREQDHGEKTGGEKTGIKYQSYSLLLLKHSKV